VVCCPLVHSYRSNARLPKGESAGRASLPGVDAAADVAVDAIEEEEERIDVDELKIPPTPSVSERRSEGMLDCCLHSG
jgi:hypothetical protein